MKKLKSETAERFISENQRIITEGKAKSFSQIAKSSGHSSQDFTDIKSGKKDLQRDFLDSVEKLYPIDKTYILTGEKGSNENITYKEIVNPDAKNRLTFSDRSQRGDFYKALPKQSEQQPFIGVPMYNIPGSASLVEMYGDANDVKIVGHLTIPGATKDSFALPVHGHSMYPTLENGSWCVLRPLTDRTDIEWGEIYYIEYGDYRMYKRLLKADEEDSVILWSDNQSEIINNRPKYAAKTIKKENIKRLCLLTDILKKPNY